MTAPAPDAREGATCGVEPYGAEAVTDAMRARQTRQAAALQAGASRPQHGRVHEIDSPEIGEPIREGNLRLGHGWGVRMLLGCGGRSDRAWISSGPIDDVHAAHQILVPADELWDVADLLDDVAAVGEGDPALCTAAELRHLHFPGIRSNRVAVGELPIGHGWTVRAAMDRGDEVHGRAWLSVGPAAELHGAYLVPLPGFTARHAADLLRDLAGQRERDIEDAAKRAEAINGDPRR